MEDSKYRACSICQGIMNNIIEANKGLPPEEARSKSRVEFQDRMGDSVCRQHYICLPLIRNDREPKHK